MPPLLQSPGNDGADSLNCLLMRTLRHVELPFWRGITHIERLRSGQLPSTGTVRGGALRPSEDAQPGWRMLLVILRRVMRESRRRPQRGNHRGEPYSGSRSRIFSFGPENLLLKDSGMVRPPGDV
jgi:hypothetical protein